MARRPPRIVAARLTKWPPKKEGFSFFRIHCNYTYPSGQKCPTQLGIGEARRARQGVRPGATRWATAPLISFRAFLRGGDGCKDGIERLAGRGIDHLGLGQFAPEFGLVVTEKTYFFDMQDGDEGVWDVFHDLGYRFSRKSRMGRSTSTSCSRTRLGSRGPTPARRPMVQARAAALEDRIDPKGEYGFTADSGHLRRCPDIARDQSLPALLKSGALDPRTRCGHQPTTICDRRRLSL